MQFRVFLLSLKWPFLPGHLTVLISFSWNSWRDKVLKICVLERSRDFISLCSLKANIVYRIIASLFWYCKIYSSSQQLILYLYLIFISNLKKVNVYWKNFNSCMFSMPILRFLIMFTTLVWVAVVIHTGFNDYLMEGFCFVTKFIVFIFFIFLID